LLLETIISLSFYFIDELDTLEFLLSKSNYYNTQQRTQAQQLHTQGYTQWWHLLVTPGCDIIR